MTADLLGALSSAAAVMAIPLLYAALGEVIAEKSGVVNIGLEGLLLLGAFTAFAVAHTTGSNLAAATAAAAAGAAAGFAFAYFAVHRRANQIVVGTALNLFAAGATATAYRAMFGVTGAATTVASSPRLAIPFLADLPVIGDALFRQTPLAYLCMLLVPVAAIFLWRTRPGLQLRMAGENPRAAAAQGVAVARVRSAALVACGALAASGGSYLALDYSHTFIEGISAGRGFIALAVVIIGRRHPVGILAAALLFGFATALQFHFQALAFAVPFQFFLVLPYAATLLLLALSAGDSNAPQALGKE